jgi:hypothetical protein
MGRETAERRLHRGHRESLFVLAELGGSEVCAWARVPTPALGLVRFPESVDVDALRKTVTSLAPGLQDEVVALHQLNRGLLALCCRHLEGAFDVLPGTFNTKARRAEVASVGMALYFVDAYLRNDDRERDNPNLLWMYNRLVAIDHGLAFAGITGPGVTGRALARKTIIHSPRGFREHVLRRALRKSNKLPIFWGVATLLESVSQADIDRLGETWPSELNATTLEGRSGLREQLIEFLDERRAHAHEIAKNLAPFLKED